MASINTLVSPEECSALVKEYGPDKGKIEIHRLYARRYYHLKKEKMLAYKSEHRKIHLSPKPSLPRKGLLYYNSSELMQAPTEKSLKMLERILQGRATFVR